MIAMPFHPSNTYTIDELKANLMIFWADVEKKYRSALMKSSTYIKRQSN